MQRQIKVNQAANTFFLSTVLFVAVFTFSLLAQPDENASVADLLPENIAPIDAPFEMPRFKRPTFPDRMFNIKDFGAVEGGKIKVTEAIRKAIEAAAKAGGGKVVIPEGIWLTGPIHLKSHINLYAAKDAEVRFSSDFTDYLPAVFSRHNGVECYKPSALLYANGCENIAITGKGLFHGYGKNWRGNANRILAPAGSRPGKLVADNVPVTHRRFDGSEGDFLRPAFVQPINCKHVFIEGVTFMYGPQWTIQPTYCENVIVRGVRVVTKGSEAYDGTPNGDGVNPDSCKNVLIEYCDMDTGDDCFAIKSGRAEDGLRVGRPCENIVIRHSQGRRGHGGVVIGSETSGGIRNVFIRDCTFNGTDRGLRFKTARGRGAVIENIWARDITMGTIRKEAIIVNTLRYTDRYPAHPVSDRTPTYRNLHFQDITCEYSKGTGIRIVGLPERPMGDLTFENIVIKGGKGIHAQDAGNVTFANIEVVPDKGPVILLDECFDVTIENANRPKDADTFIQLIGEKTKNIKMDGVDVTAAKTKGT